MEEHTQRKKESQLTLLLLLPVTCLLLSLSNYLSAGVSAAERPIVTTEQPANLAGTGVTKQGAPARPLAYPVVIGSL